MTRHRVALAAAVASVLLAGCGDSRGVDPEPHPDVTASDAPVRVVGKDAADLVLYVSNQSFDDEEVRLTVEVDGITVVEGDFHVEGQHNWVSFPLAMPAGRHELTAESDSGAGLRETFTTTDTKPRYAVIDHWTEDGSGDLTWLFSRRPVGFA